MQSSGTKALSSPPRDLRSHQLPAPRPGSTTQRRQTRGLSIPPRQPRCLGEQSPGRLRRIVGQPRRKSGTLVNLPVQASDAPIRAHVNPQVEKQFLVRGISAPERNSSRLPRMTGSTARVERWFLAPMTVAERVAKAGRRDNGVPPRAIGRAAICANAPVRVEILIPRTGSGDDGAT